MRVFDFLKTIEDVSFETGTISVEELADLESGENGSSLDTYYALVNAYNLDPDEFIEILEALPQAQEPAARQVKR